MIPAIAIRQINTKLFVDTLAKGVSLVAVAVAALIVSTLWFNEFVKSWLVLVTGFCGVASVLLLFEVWVDLRRHSDEEIDFVEDKTPSNITDIPATPALHKKSFLI